MKRLAQLSALLCLPSFLSAQSLPEGLTAGVRAGISSGFTAKLYTDDSSEALEAILSFRSGALGLTALYEFHRTDFDIDGLRWYYGGGAELNLYEQGLHDSPIGIAIDGVLGLEYVLPEAPLIFSLDYKPAFFLVGDPGLANGGALANGGGLSARYVF
jgi:hypothetical protein